MPQTKQYKTGDHVVVVGYPSPDWCGPAIVQSDSWMGSVTVKPKAGPLEGESGAFDLRYVQHDTGDELAVFKEHVKRITMEWPEGCDDGKREFLRMLDIDTKPEPLVDVALSTSVRLRIDEGGDRPSETATANGKVRVLIGDLDDPNADIVVRWVYKSVLQELAADIKENL